MLMSLLELHQVSKHFGGLQVVSDLKEFSSSAVFVVSDGKRAQATFDSLVARIGRDRVICPRFLRVSQGLPGRTEHTRGPADVATNGGKGG